MYVGYAGRRKTKAQRLHDREEQMKRREEARQHCSNCVSIPCECDKMADAL